MQIPARVLHRLECALDWLVGQPANPLRQLGALGFWLFWIVVASGAYVYVFFDTGVEGAYASIAGWSREPWSAAQLMRSVHRYASDAFALVLALHALRELALGRFRGFRGFTWITGLAVAGLAFASGVIGYWLVWDQRAQFIGIAVAEWLESLPGLGSGLVRNFIAPEMLTDRFFSLLAFAHIGVCLMLLAGMWLHIQRLALPRCHPGRSTALGMLATLAALAVLKPALSEPAVELLRAPSEVPLDWIYLAPLALFDGLPPGAAWIATAAAAIALFALPAFGRRAAPAHVDAGHCNGCARCVPDCPYAAIVVVPDASTHRKLAQVLPGRCAACGICSGACPASVPVHGTVRTAIDIAHAPIRTLWRRVERSLARPGSVLVFACARAARIDAPADGTSVFTLPCIGMLPPAFAAQALKRGAGAVLVAGCGPGCEFRLGSRWTGLRISGEREPRLRAGLEPECVRFVEAGPGEEQVLAEALLSLRPASLLRRARVAAESEVSCPG